MPQITIKDGATPVVPSSGYGSLYLDTADNVLKIIKDTGIVVSLEGGGGGSFTCVDVGNCISSDASTQASLKTYIEGTAFNALEATNITGTTANITNIISDNIDAVDVEIDDLDVVSSLVMLDNSDMTFATGTTLSFGDTDVSGSVDYISGYQENYESGSSSIYESGSQITHQSGALENHELGSTDTYESGSNLSLDGDITYGNASTTTGDQAFDSGYTADYTNSTINLGSTSTINGGTIDGATIENATIQNSNTDNQTVNEATSFVEQSVTPATPATGEVKLYAKDDGNMYQLDDTGSETALGGGGSGATYEMVSGLNETIFIPANAPLTGTITVPVGVNFSNTEFSLYVGYEELSGGNDDGSFILRGNFDCRVPTGSLSAAIDMATFSTGSLNVTYGNSLSIGKSTLLSVNVNSGPTVSITGVYRDGTDLKIDWSVGLNGNTANLLVQTSPIIAR